MEDFVFGKKVLVFGDPDRFSDILEGDFDIEVVFFCAEDEADGGLFIRGFFQAVQEREIVVHLTDVFGLELAYFQVDRYHPVQAPVEK